MLDETPHADRAAIDGSVGGLGAFGVAEAGQLVKANIDKRTAKAIGDQCDAAWTKALNDARPRRKFLGVL